LKQRFFTFPHAEISEWLQYPVSVAHDTLGDMCTCCKCWHAVQHWIRSISTLSFFIQLVFPLFDSSILRLSVRLPLFRSQVPYCTVLYCTVQQRKSASCDNDVEYPYRTGQNEHRTKISFASSSYPVICRNLSSSVSRSRLTYLIQIPCVVLRSTLVSSLMRRERERERCLRLR
jgi:hypothetical protein